MLIKDEDIPIETRLAQLLAAAREVLQHLGAQELSQWEAILTPATLLPEDAAQMLAGPEHP